MDYTEIDNYLKKIKEENEIKNYIDNGILPDHMKKKDTPKNIPKLEEKEYPDFVPISYNCDKLVDKMNKLEEQLNNYSNNENNKEMCPVCLNEIKENNYVLPSCNHKICISCFVLNLNKNRSSGNNCCLCRETILSI